MPESQILLVEDDANLAFVTKDNLEMKGYKVKHAADGLAGWDIFSREPFDLCILDVMLPKLDGFTLAEKIRQRDKNIPILFLTAKAMLDDKIAGFKTGADDYISKPFSIEELIFKVEVFLKRSKISIDYPGEKSKFKIGSFDFDFSNLLLKINDNEESLTLREGEVLRLLCLKQNQVVPRDEILKQIWGADDYYIGRSLDVFISRLRKYLKADPTVSIENVHSVGFKLVVRS